MSENPINILIVDDHDLVRDGIKARIALSENIDVCGEANCGADAIKLATELKPDIIFLDISMPNMNGLEAAEKIIDTCPETKILFLSIYDNPEYIHEAFRVGAKGYMLKDVSREEMAVAVNAVHNGGTYLGSNIAEIFTQKISKPETENCVYNLTNREREVLWLISKGSSNKEIAASLEISVRTVESHRMAIREKTGGGNAADLARIANTLKI